MSVNTPNMPQKLPEEFVAFWHALIAHYNENLAVAHRMLKRLWYEQQPIPGYAGHSGWPAIPRGWSARSLYRHQLPASAFAQRQISKD